MPAASVRCLCDARPCWLPSDRLLTCCSSPSCFRIHSVNLLLHQEVLTKTALDKETMDLLIPFHREMQLEAPDAKEIARRGYNITVRPVRLSLSRRVCHFHPFVLFFRVRAPRRSLECLPITPTPGFVQFSLSSC